MMRLDQLLPLTICLLLTILAAVILSKDLSTGKNLHQDEFHSLERSYGFIKHDDWWSVYSQNEASGKKPPLQYWLNAVLFKLDVNELLSLRFWSYVFFLALLVVCAVFSTSLAGGNWWSGLTCSLILLNSAVLVDLSRTGLLDAGAGLFFILCLYTLYLTQRSDKAWVLCGLMIGLGALQKAPIGLVLVPFAIWIMAKTGNTGYRWKTLQQNKYFNRGKYLALFLVLSWPIIQCFKIGVIYLRVAIQKEMLKRFSPVDDTAIAEREFFRWIDWLWNDIYLLSIIVAACLLFVLFSKRWRGSFLFALATVAVFVMVAFTIASGNIYARYLAMLTPLLAVISAVVLTDLAGKWQPAVCIVIAALSFFSVDNIQHRLDSINQQDTVTPVRKIIEVIDQYRKPDDFIVQEQTIIPLGSYGYFGKSKKSAFAYDIGTKRFRRFFEREGHAMPLIGIVGADETDALKKVISDVDIITVIDGVAYWRYSPD